MRPTVKTSLLFSNVRFYFLSFFFKCLQNEKKPRGIASGLSICLLKYVWTAPTGITSLKIAYSDESFSTFSL